MDSVMELLDVLEDLLESSRSVPFSSKVSVDKEEIFDIIKDIRLFLPNEIKQSKWVVDERTKILEDARKEAAEIIQDAENKVQKLIDETDIAKGAHEEAQRILEKAEQTSKEMRINAMEYVDNILEQTQERMQASLDEYKMQTGIVENFYTQLMETIYTNRQELRESAKEKAAAPSEK